MSDNKDQRDGRDSSKVAGNEDYELQHIAQKMGVTEPIKWNFTKFLIDKSGKPVKRSYCGVRPHLLAVFTTKMVLP